MRRAEASHAHHAMLYRDAARDAPAEAYGASSVWWCNRTGGNGGVLKACARRIWAAAPRAQICVLCFRLGVCSGTPLPSGPVGHSNDTGLARDNLR